MSWQIKKDDKCQLHCLPNLKLGHVHTTILGILSHGNKMHTFFRIKQYVVNANRAHLTQTISTLMMSQSVRTCLNSEFLYIDYTTLPCLYPNEHGCVTTHI